MVFMRACTIVDYALYHAGEINRLGGTVLRGCHTLVQLLSFSTVKSFSMKRENSVARISQVQIPIISLMQVS